MDEAKSNSTIPATEKATADVRSYLTKPVVRTRTGPSMRDELRAALTTLRETIVVMDKSIAEVERILDHHFDGQR